MFKEAIFRSAGHVYMYIGVMYSVVTVLLELFYMYGFCIRMTTMLECSGMLIIWTPIIRTFGFIWTPNWLLN